jgi:DNA polymerase
METPADPVGRVVDNLIRYLENLKEDGVAGIELSRESTASPRPPPESVAVAHIGRLAARSPITDLMPGLPSGANVTAIPVIPEMRATVPVDELAVKAELSAIASKVAACTQCSLHRTRTKTVPGQGHFRPDILFVGEGPGADEDLQGLAFIGRAGQLLTRLIHRMGYRREDVFIANVVKCRPPENRKPLPDEIDACRAYLKSQIAVLVPKVIVALGASALEGLLATQEKVFISRMRGKWLSYGNTPLMPTFHPSYLLRNQSAMWDVWNDMQAVLKLLGRVPPPKNPG